MKIIMTQTSNRLFSFWQELVRRRVVHFLIAYVAASFAIIEFFDITSDRFTIPENTFKLLYILAAIGLPLVIVLPWIINRKKPDTETDEMPPKEIPSEEIETAKHNLPSQITTFIGREKEMQVIKDLISIHRLVTLTGSGGCGKTRLACEAAIPMVSEFKDGVWFVDLSPIASEDLVAKEIAEALKIAEVPNKPIIDMLNDKIRDQHLLIILDNCEHLIKTCSEITGKLVQSTPGLKILATSRQALGITGEKVWRVPSLTLLDPKAIVDVESVKDSEAVMLFKDRAQLNNPDFELELENVSEVVTICNKVEGIPLALELVASRTKFMDPKTILERFTDRFDQLPSSDPGISKRQQTLQATIEWSYNLLSDSEKLLFTRLSVFSGGFDLKAAEYVGSDDQLLNEPLLEALSRLVDRSLVYTVKADDQSMRYKMLETLRQFAQQTINSRKEDEPARKKHLEYFLSMAEQAYEEQYESQSKWLNKLTVEEDNLLAALEWSSDNATEEFIRLSGSLSWLWINGCAYLAGKEYLEVAISKDTSKSDARVLYGLGHILIFFGELDRANTLIKKSLTIWKRTKKHKELAGGLAMMGYLYITKFNDIESGFKYSEQALELVKSLDNPGLTNRSLTMLSASLVHSKQFEKAIPYVEELLISSEKLNQPFDMLSALHYRSDCALGINDYKEAERRYGLGIQTGMEYGNIFVAIADMQGIAFALSGQSRWQKSLRLNAASMEKARCLGLNMYGIHAFWDDWIDTYIEGAKKEVGEELARKYEEEGIAMGFEKAVEYALDFDKD